ncbi:MAG: hypothetical protein JXR44_00615 [Thiotrichales bacterium]|nr:hypothetical protein [Thiotrichales bacterium]
MLLKRTHTLLEILLGLFVLYLLLSRLLILGVQQAPQQTLSWVERWSGVAISVQEIKLKQTWLGVEFDLSNVSIRSEQLVLEAHHLQGDINLFAPLVPLISYGERLQVTQLSVRKRASATDSVSDLVPQSAQALTDVYAQLVDFLRSRAFTQRLWQKVSIDRLVANDFLFAQGSVLQIDRLDWVKGRQINLVAEFSIRYLPLLDFEKFSLRLNLSPNSWGGISHGQMDLLSYQPLPVQRFANLLPQKWAEVLPNGEALLELNAQLQDSRIKQMQLSLNAQALQWPQDNGVLPQSLGLQVKWHPFAEAGSLEQRMHFELSRIQLDNRYVQTLSPIELTLATDKTLELKADRFDIAPFKQMLRVFIEGPYVNGLLNQAVELQLADFALVLNWETLQVPSLQMEVARLGIPLTDYPGVAAQAVKLQKKAQQLTLQTLQPVWVYEPAIHNKPMRLDLPPQLSVNLNKQELSAFTVRADGLRFDVSRLVYGQQGLQFSTQVNAPSVALLRQYLPYRWMEDDLSNWLKDAQLQGGSVAFQADYDETTLSADDRTQPQWMQSLRALKLKGAIAQAGFRFQSDWPAVVNSDLQFELVDANLLIRSDALSLDGVPTAFPVVAKLAHLDRKDLALELQGKVALPMTELFAFLPRTPLLRQLGVADWFVDVTRIEGQAELELSRIWVPLSGWKNKEEQVTGSLMIRDGLLQREHQSTVSGIQGRLDFTENSLNAQNLKLFLLGGPAKLSIRTVTKSDLMRFTLEGESADKRLKPYFSRSLPYRLQFDYALKKVNHPLQFQGSLQVHQAQSRLPSPFSAQDLQNSMEISGTYLNGQLVLNSLMRDQLQTLLHWDLNAAQLQLLQVYLGEMVDAQRNWGGEDFFIRGKLSNLNLGVWWQWWEKQTETPSSNAFANVVWQASQLKIKRLAYDQRVFDEASISLQTLPNQVQKVELQSQQMQAKALVPPQGTIQLEIEKLHLQSQQDVKTNVVGKETCPLQPSQREYRALNLQARNVHYDQYQFDQLSFEMRPMSVGYEAKNFVAQLAEGAGLIKGEYRYDQQKNLSAANFDLQTANLNALIKLLGINRGIQSEQSSIRSEVAWFGGIDCFELDRLYGKLDFQLAQGVVKDVEPGFARLLGLLSVDSLARRLQLKLDDVTNKGLVYDEIKGKALLNESQLRLQLFKLNAPAAQIGLQGFINLSEEQFALTAQVTPAIGSSLPTIAALAGIANPLAAIAVYTLLKALPDVNENLITYEYRISGPWQNPEIRLQPLNQSQDN